MNMRFFLGICAAIVLASLHLAVAYAILHPKVSPEYARHFVARTSSDWHVTHYHSTPEDGIEFSRRGWPDFVKSSYGISADSSSGRWTDTRLGLNAGFEFDQPFQGRQCVVLSAMPSDAMRGHSAKLAFGTEEVVINFGRERGFRPYFVDFDLPSPATKLSFKFPRAFPRLAADNPRQYGIGLERLQIVAQPCALVAAVR